MKKNLFIIAGLVCSSLLQAQTLDPYFLNPENNVFTIINANGGNGVVKPNDLDFNPLTINSPMELWVINEGTENTGGKTVTFYDAGEVSQTFKVKQDGNAWHFMSLPSGMAFSETGDWANSPNVFSANHNTTPFTGPSLWSSDMTVYAVNHGPGTNGSHLDMLHQSPYSLGIASDTQNVFWVNDAYNQNIVRYDFALDHGPGNDFHGDGKVHFYKEIRTAARPAGLPGLPSHLVMDKSDKTLYICDNANSRIIRMDSRSATKKADLNFNLENLAERWEMENTNWGVINANVVAPTGIDVYGDRLVVTDNSTGEFIFFNIADTSNIYETGRIAVDYAPHNIRGVKVGPDGKIWFVDYGSNKVYRIDNPSVWGIGVNEHSVEVPFEVYPNPGSDFVNVMVPENFEGSIEILAANGQKVAEHSVHDFTNRIDVSQGKKGLYIIQLISKQGAIVGRQKWLKSN